MYEIFVSSQFKKDIKSYRYMQKIITTTQSVIENIRSQKLLPKKYNDHGLKWIFSGVRECHIFPDVLLIYEIDEKNNCIRLIRMGSHSELFG